MALDEAAVAKLLSGPPCAELTLLRLFFPEPGDTSADAVMQRVGRANNVRAAVRIFASHVFETDAPTDAQLQEISDALRALIRIGVLDSDAQQ